MLHWARGSCDRARDSWGSVCKIAFYEVPGEIQEGVSMGDSVHNVADHARFAPPAAIRKLRVAFALCRRGIYPSWPTAYL